MLLFQTIPPGVLHLCGVMVKRLVDDDDDDDGTAPEVQTNFISSQKLTMIVYLVISSMMMTMLMNNIITIILFGIPNYCCPSIFFSSCYSCSCFMLLRTPAPLSSSVLLAPSNTTISYYHYYLALSLIHI